MSGNRHKAASNTRQQLLNSFNALVLNGKEGKITVADVVREAGLGRSTFYDHYASASDIHEQALAAPMTLLAESLLGVRQASELSHLLAHFQEYRARARHTLFGEEGENVEKLLVAILESRLANGNGPLAPDRKIAAIELAAVCMALLRAWLKDTIRCDSKEMSRHILDAGTTLRQTLLV